MRYSLERLRTTMRGSAMCSEPEARAALGFALALGIGLRADDDLCSFLEIAAHQLAVGAVREPDADVDGLGLAVGVGDPRAPASPRRAHPFPAPGSSPRSVCAAPG